MSRSVKINSFKIIATLVLSPSAFADTRTADRLTEALLSFQKEKVCEAKNALFDFYKGQANSALQVAAIDRENLIAKLQLKHWIEERNSTGDPNDTLGATLSRSPNQERRVSSIYQLNDQKKSALDSKYQSALASVKDPSMPVSNEDVKKFLDEAGYKLPYLGNKLDGSGNLIITFQGTRNKTYDLTYAPGQIIASLSTRDPIDGPRLYLNATSPDGDEMGPGAIALSIGLRTNQCLGEAIMPGSPSATVDFDQGKSSSSTSGVDRARFVNLVNKVNAEVPASACVIDGLVQKDSASSGSKGVVSDDRTQNQGDLGLQ